MEHTGIFLTILALAAGAVSLTHTIYLYQRTRLRYLKRHNIVFCLFNFQELMGLAFNYVQFNVFAQLSGSTARKIFAVYHFQLSLVSIIILYGFILIAFELVRREWTNKWKIGFFITFGVLILAQVTSSVLFLELGLPPIHILFLAVIVLSAEIITLVISIRVFFAASSLPGKERQSALKKFALLILAVFLSVLILNILQLRRWISVEIYVFILSLFLVPVNLLPLLFMRGFIKKIFPEYSSESGSGEFRSHLFQEYKISGREQEIIRLICQGKSNREIEDELFISLQTVKDHVYSIYRKTGVKNRVQLTNLFRRLEEGDI